MAKMIFLMAMVATLALFGSTAAQTTHQVGNALGWVVPPGGDAAYATWASTKTFIVGDILVFNFSTGSHSVAEVTKAAYSQCATSSPISISTTGPTSLTLTTAGEHFYLCTFPGHCSFGQKLSINVSTSPSPSPAPESSSPTPTPSPVPVPEPTPSTVPSPSPSQSPEGSATPPSSGATPPSSEGISPPGATIPDSPLPPGNSAPSSVAVAALPITLLTIALAYLY